MASIFPSNFRGPLEDIAWHYAWTVPIVVLLGLVSSALEGAGVGLLIPLIATMLADDTSQIPGALKKLLSFADGISLQDRLLLIGSCIFLLIVLKNLFVYLNEVFVSWIDGRASHDIRSALTRRLLTVGYPFFLAEDPARLINIIATESWRASDAIRAMFLMLASAGSIAVFLLLLVLIDVRLTAAVIVGTLAIRGVQHLVMARMGRISQEMTAANNALADRMLVSVWSMRLIRVYGQERSEQARFDSSSDTMRHLSFKLNEKSARVSPLQEILQAGLFILLLVGTILLDPRTSVPSLVAFLVLLQRMQPHLRAIEGARATLAATEGPVGEVAWLLNPEGKPASTSGNRPYSGLEKAIEFRDVQFRYTTRPGGPPALNSATFAIAAGKSTAIIGASGAGKSTIVNLLCRLYEPTAGAMLVDGQPLSEIDPIAWRSRIGLAGQDIELLDGSIADNIRYGAPEASDATIREAARVADADAFVSGLPQGYDTEVGSRGISLSGGQRQRISLARALARKPDLLILDEATNAVDGLSEASILQRIRDADWQTTVIVISHRAATLAYCDQGVVLQDGVVVESGFLGDLDAYREMAPRPA